MYNTIRLPEFLSELEVVEPLKEGLKGLTAGINTNEEIAFDVKMYDSPVSIIPGIRKEAYARNDMPFIKEQDDTARKHMEVIKENIKTNGDKAWIKARYDGVEFYISYTNDACMWVYPLSSKKTNDDKTELVIMMGSYDNTTNTATSSTLSFVTVAKYTFELIISCICTKVFYEIALRGLVWGASAIAAILAEKAASMGLANFAFTVSATALKFVAGAFSLAFCVGAMLLFDWLISQLVKDYCITLNIYNVDENNDWKTINHAFDNAIIAGDNIGFEDFTLSKKGPAEVPSFLPITTDDTIVRYAQINLKNDNTFMEGLAVALSMMTGDSNSSLSLCVDCPFFSPTRQKIKSPADPDLENYINSGVWADGNKSNITINGIPVSIYLHDTSGAPNDLYIADVFIGGNI